jgi:hypothetical protein
MKKWFKDLVYRWRVAYFCALQREVRVCDIGLMDSLQENDFTRAARWAKKATLAVQRRDEYKTKYAL